MNLDIGILWIEDAFNDEEEAALKRRIEEVGFLPRIENLQTSHGIEDLAAENAVKHSFDLILLDYKLKDEERGDAIAPYVRELFPNTNILFYSSAYHDDGLRALIAEKKVEGVYCCHRDRFVEKTGQLIDQIAHALSRLSGMRGLSMQVVSECDGIMQAGIRYLMERDKACADLITEMDQSVFEHLNSQKEKYETAQKGSFDDRVKTRSIDSQKTFSHFRRLTEQVTRRPSDFDLSGDQLDQLRELRRSTAQYYENVILRRNQLGHVVERSTDKGWILEGDAAITVNDFPDLRRAFAEHINAFKEMISILGVAARE